MASATTATPETKTPPAITAGGAPLAPIAINWLANLLDEGESARGRADGPDATTDAA
jgi:hypothetical protein